VCEREFKGSILFLNGDFFKLSENGIVFEQRFLKFGFHAKIFEPRNFQTLVFEWSLHRKISSRGHQLEVFNRSERFLVRVSVEKLELDQSK
jgi:hypothetical protein